MMMTMMMMMTERRRLGRETRRRTHTTRELLRINLQLCCYYKYIVGLDVARIRIIRIIFFCRQILVLLIVF
jgi:hypothetical protein